MKLIWPPTHADFAEPLAMLGTNLGDLAVDQVHAKISEGNFVVLLASIAGNVAIDARRLASTICPREMPPSLVGTRWCQ